MELKTDTLHCNTQFPPDFTDCRYRVLCGEQLDVGNGVRRLFGILMWMKDRFCVRFTLVENVSVEADANAANIHTKLCVEQ